MSAPGGFDFAAWSVWTQVGAFASLAGRPYLRALLGAMPERRRGVGRLLGSLVQAELAYGLVAAAGVLAGRAAGLPVGLTWPRSLARAAALGAATAVALMALDLAFFGQVRSELRGRIPPIPPRARLLACLDGAVAEEVLMRLCALSVLAAGFRLVWRGNTAIWAAIAVSSLLFGAGHLPATARILRLTVPVVARALILNAIGGVVFGIVYWTDGLAAAMAAHGCADLVLSVVPALGRTTVRPRGHPP